MTVLYTLGWFVWAGACSAALYFFQKSETKKYIKNYHNEQ